MDNSVFVTIPIFVALALWQWQLMRRAHRKGTAENERVRDLVRQFTPTIPTGLRGDYEFRNLKTVKPVYDWAKDGE